MIICEKKKTLNNPKDVSCMIISILGKEHSADRDKEHFWTIGLNTKLVSQYVDLVTLGILDKCISHPREIFRLAVMKAVSSIIIVHNHPSGDTAPSDDDIKMTKQIVNAGRILGIYVYDHIIIGNPSFESEDSCAYPRFNSLKETMDTIFIKEEGTL